MSQNRQIYRHMKNHRTITPIESLKLFGCMRLASRIFELRKTYAIEAERVTRNGKTFCRYRLSP